MVKRARKNMRDKAIKQGEILDAKFFQENESFIWDRTRNSGYIAIPRILPLAMQAIDNKTKGKPAGHVYFCLWSRSPDYSLVTINSQQTFAFEAGFSGERAIDTWKGRIRSLQDLGFIKAFSGPSGEFHHIVLYDPVYILGLFWKRKQIQKDLYMRICDRAFEIGAESSIDLAESGTHEEKSNIILKGG